VNALTSLERGVLALLAVAGIGAPLLETWIHGPVQGCAIAFAGLGFGCGL
jgi:hypothetical protein